MFRMNRIGAAALFAALLGLTAAQPAAASPLATSQGASQLATTATGVEKVQYYYGPPRRYWGHPRYHRRHWRGHRWRDGRYWGPPPRSRVVCRTVFTDWGPRRVCRRW